MEGKEEETNMEAFDMRNHWYPLLFSEELQRSRPSGKPQPPYGLHLLGDPVVLFRDEHGEAQCVLDKCPHRSAPLSVGEVRDGRLECKYHGWQFGTGGQCEFIPSEPAMKPGRPFCVYAYPTTEIYARAFAFIEDPAKASNELIPHHILKEYGKKEWGYDLVTRDFELDHGLYIENVLDPSHLPFTHEGTLSKRSKATEMKVEMLFDNIFRKGDTNAACTEAESTNNTPFTLGVPQPFRALQASGKYPDEASRPDQRFTFQAPCIVRLDLQTSTKKKSDGSLPYLIQVHFVIPLTPTRMRTNIFFFRNFAVGMTTSHGSRIGKRINAWYADKILDQDVELLTGQMINLLNYAKPWNTTVRADKISARYRKWRDIAEKSNPWFYAFHQPPIPDIEDLVFEAQAEEAKVTDGGNKEIKSQQASAKEALARRKKTSRTAPPVVTGPYPKSGALTDVSTLLMNSAGSRFKPRSRISLIPLGVQLVASSVGAIVLAGFTYWWFYAD